MLVELGEEVEEVDEVVVGIGHGTRMDVTVLVVVIGEYVVVDVDGDKSRISEVVVVVGDDDGEMMDVTGLVTDEVVVSLVVDGVAGTRIDVAGPSIDEVADVIGLKMDEVVDETKFSIDDVSGAT